MRQLALLPTPQTCQWNSWPHYLNPKLVSGTAGLSPDVILCGWLGLKHQLTKITIYTPNLSVRQLALLPIPKTCQWDSWPYYLAFKLVSETASLTTYTQNLSVRQLALLPTPQTCQWNSWPYYLYLRLVSETAGLTTYTSNLSVRQLALLPVFQACHWDSCPTLLHLRLVSETLLQYSAKRRKKKKTVLRQLLHFYIFFLTCAWLATVLAMENEGRDITVYNRFNLADVSFCHCKLDLDWCKFQGMSKHEKDANSEQRELILTLIQEGHCARELTQFVGMCESAVSEFLKKFSKTGCEERQQCCDGQERSLNMGERNFPGSLFMIISRLLRDITVKLKPTSEEKCAFRTTQRQLHTMGYRLWVVWKSMVVGEVNRKLA